MKSSQFACAGSVLCSRRCELRERNDWRGPRPGRQAVRVFLKDGRKLKAWHDQEEIFCQGIGGSSASSQRTEVPLICSHGNSSRKMSGLPLAAFL